MYLDNRNELLVLMANLVGIQFADETELTLCRYQVSFDFVDEMYHKGYLPKVFNDCFWSSGAEYLIVRIAEAVGLTENDDLSVLEAKVINYLRRNKHAAGSIYRKPMFQFVKQDLKAFIRTSEYDGLESIYFDENYHFFKSVTEVMNSGNNNDMKIDAIKHLLENDFSADAIVPMARVSEELTTPSDRRRELQVLKKVRPPLPTQKEDDNNWIEVKQKKGRNKQ